MLGISDAWPHQSERCVAGVECPEPPCLGAAGLWRVPAALLWFCARLTLGFRAMKWREKRHSQKALPTHSASLLWAAFGAAPLLSTRTPSGQRPAEGRPTQQTLAPATFKVREGETQGPMQVQTRASWPGFSPPTHFPVPTCRHLRSRTSLFVPLQVTRMPV